MSGEVKIFEMSPTDWVAAYDLESATQCLKEMFGLEEANPEELSSYIDEPRVLTGTELDMLKWVDCDEDDQPIETSRKTFRERLEELKSKGQTFPVFFASSEN